MTPGFFPKGQEEEKYREFRETCEKADGELVTLYNGMCKEDPDKAKIFSAHRELLQDEEILDEIREAICAESMAQRVALVRSLINHPDILLLDEPLGALDAFTRMNMQDEILNIWREQKQTVVMVTCRIYRRNE